MRTSTEQARKWRAHVAKASTWPGSFESYCRTAGVSAPALRYWKKKMAAKEISGFVPVEVVVEQPSSQKSLPDPRWVAEFVGHLFGGAR